jgi:hypothetical protein
VSAMRVFVAHWLPATASLGRVPPKASDGSSDSRGLVLVVSAESSQETLMRRNQCGWASCCHAATLDSHTCTARRTSRTGRLCTMRKGPAWYTRAKHATLISHTVVRFRGPNAKEKKFQTKAPKKRRAPLSGWKVLKALEQRRVGGRQRGTRRRELGASRCTLARAQLSNISYERYDGAFARRTQPNLCYFPFPK